MRIFRRVTHDFGKYFAIRIHITAFILYALKVSVFLLCSRVVRRRNLFIFTHYLQISSKPGNIGQNTHYTTIDIYSVFGNAKPFKDIFS